MTFFHLGAEHQEPDAEFSIDWPGGHQTRGGWPARLLGTINAPSGRRYVFAVTDSQGFDHVNRVFANGMEQNGGFQKPNDIVNAQAPEPRVMTIGEWVRAQYLSNNYHPYEPARL